VIHGATGTPLQALGAEGPPLVRTRPRRFSNCPEREHPANHPAERPSAGFHWLGPAAAGLGRCCRRGLAVAFAHCSPDGGDLFITRFLVRHPHVLLLPFCLRLLVLPCGMRWQLRDNKAGQELLYLVRTQDNLD